MSPAAQAPRAVTGLTARDGQFMSAALEAARRAAVSGQPPVGACIVHGGELLAVAANSVVAELDPTAHAEVMAIRAACRDARRIDLRGGEIYSTVEPCLMCLAACHYAGIRRVVFGASLADMQAVTGRELMTVSDPALLAPGIELHGGCLRGESLALLRRWAVGAAS